MSFIQPNASLEAVETSILAIFQRTNDSRLEGIETSLLEEMYDLREELERAKLTCDTDYHGMVEDMSNSVTTRLQGQIMHSEMIASSSTGDINEGSFQFPTSSAFHNHKRSPTFAQTQQSPWREYHDEEGKVYYHNIHTNITQWECPLGYPSPNQTQNPPNSNSTQTDKDLLDLNLPPGWAAYKHVDGRIYYHNSNTSQSTWDFPTN
eukprot:c28521_g1_i1.p1 GENE.c28521_g1_i1~~c28521_g1_i1.p1  ORF type:complete len:207 (-),score=89.18 c28521_g1_i1:19-639(-)